MHCLKARKHDPKMKFYLRQQWKMRQFLRAKAATAFSAS